MLLGLLSKLQKRILPEAANGILYSVCGILFLLNILTFAMGLFFKINLLPIVLITAIGGFITFVFICPKLTEKKQKAGFFFCYVYPVTIMTSMLTTPLIRISESMKDDGKPGSAVASIVPVVTFIVVIAFIMLYIGNRDNKKIAEFKEKIKEGFKSAGADEKKDGDVVLCVEKESGKPEIWPYKDRFLHMLILGPTGSGKTSQTILPLVNQDMQNSGIGITILEPKGDLAQKAAMMAEHYGRRYVYFDPSFNSCPFFNPLYGDESEVVENIATTFRILNPDSPQFFLDLNEQLVRNALKVLKRLDADETRKTGKDCDGYYSRLINLSTLLQNTAGKGKELVNKFAGIAAPTEEEHKENQDIASWFVLDYFQERSKVYENTSGLRSQVSKLISNKYLRHVLNPDPTKGEKNQIDFSKHLEEGGVICISTAQGALRDMGKYLGYFIILQLQSAVFRRPGNEDTRRPHSLYIDEFQTYSNPGFSDMLTQGRSYRVASHLATQARAQMAMGGGKDGKNFVELLSTNARNIVLYPGCSKDDAEYYSKQFGEYMKAEVQVGRSYKEFNPLTGGFDKLGHPTKTVRETEKLTAVFTPTDLIYRPFGEIVYCIIKNNSIQTPKVGKIEYIPIELNKKLDQMIANFIEEDKKFGEEKNHKNEVDQAALEDGGEDLAGGINTPIDPEIGKVSPESISTRHDPSDIEAFSGGLDEDDVEEE